MSRIVNWGNFIRGRAALLEGDVETPSPIASATMTKYLACYPTTFPGPTNSNRSSLLPPSHVGQSTAFDFSAFICPACDTRCEIHAPQFTLQFELAELANCCAPSAACAGIGCTLVRKHKKRAAMQSLRKVVSHVSSGEWPIEVFLLHLFKFARPSTLQGTVSGSRYNRSGATRAEERKILVQTE